MSRPHEPRRSIESPAGWLFSKACIHLTWGDTGSATAEGVPASSYEQPCRCNSVSHLWQCTRACELCHARCPWFATLQPPGLENVKGPPWLAMVKWSNESTTTATAPHRHGVEVSPAPGRQHSRFSSASPPSTASASAHNGRRVALSLDRESKSTVMKVACEYRSYQHVEDVITIYP